jgi:putative chitinase
MTPEELYKIASITYSSEDSLLKLKKRIDIYFPLLNRYMTEYDIVKRLRESAFISQILYESDCFSYTKEISSGAEYEGRKDLGNINKGDGEKFKGRGLIQITGRYNYTLLSKAFNIDLINNPQLLEEPDLATRSACWFWNVHKLNYLADNFSFIEITRRVNGGLNGYRERYKYYQKALSIIE